jgi:hypothetical protein
MQEVVSAFLLQQRVSNADWTSKSTFLACPLCSLSGGFTSFLKSHSFFGGGLGYGVTVVWTQGLALARQAFCHLSHM